MKIAFLSPLPPSRSGIADYSARLLPFLTSNHEIHSFHNDILPDRSILPDKVILHHYLQFPRLYARESYDLVLYQMGNSIHHLFVYFLMHYFPGIVDLHDLNLHGFVAHIHSPAHSNRAYHQILKKKHGSRGLKLAEITEAGLYSENQAYLFPLIPEGVTRHRQWIIHNPSSLEKMRKLYPDITINCVPPFHRKRESPSEKAQTQLKLELGYDHDHLLCCAFGEILPKKGVFQIIEAFQKLQTQSQKVKMVFVGQPGKITAFEKLSLPPNVKITGFVPHSLYKKYLEACDMGINLRFPSVGEMSQTLLEMMSHGKPVIISHTPDNACFPTNSVMKILPGENTVQELVRILTLLHSEESRRREIGDQASQHIDLHYSKSCSIEKYLDIIEDTTAYGSSSNWPDVDLTNIDRQMAQWLAHCMSPRLAAAGFPSDSHLTSILASQMFKDTVQVE